MVSRLCQQNHVKNNLLYRGRIRVNSILYALNNKTVIHGDKGHQRHICSGFLLLLFHLDMDFYFYYHLRYSSGVWLLYRALCLKKCFSQVSAVIMQLFILLPLGRPLWSVVLWIYLQNRLHCVALDACSWQSDKIPLFTFRLVLYLLSLYQSLPHILPELLDESSGNKYRFLYGLCFFLSFQKNGLYYVWISPIPPYPTLLDGTRNKITSELPGTYSTLSATTCFLQ